MKPPLVSGSASSVLSEVRAIHQSLHGVCGVLEEILKTTQQNGRYLREIRDGMPNYGRRLGDE